METAIKELANEWKTGIAAKIKSELDPRITKAKTFLEQFKDGVKLGGGKNPCDKLKEDAIGVIQRKEMLIQTALNDWTAHSEAILPGLTHDGKPLTNKADAIAALLTLSEDYIRPLFADAAQDVSKAGEGVEKARAIILDLRTEFEAIVRRARQRIDQFVAGYDRTKPWSTERRKAFHAGLKACASNVQGDIEALIGEARQRFAAELGDASQTIAGFLAKALAEVDRQKGDVLSDLGSLRIIVHPYIERARELLEKLEPAAGGGILDKSLVGIASASTSIANNTSIDQSLKDEAAIVLAALNKVVLDAKGLASKARTKLRSIETITDDSIGEFAALVVDLANGLKEIVTALTNKTAELTALADKFAQAGFGTIQQQLLSAWTGVDETIGDLKETIAKKIAPLEAKLDEIGQLLDFLASSTAERLQNGIDELSAGVSAIEGQITGLIDDVQGALGAVQQALAPKGLLETVVKRSILEPALVEVLKPLTDDHFKNTEATLELIHRQLRELSNSVSGKIRELRASILDTVGQISDACNAAFESVDKAQEYLKALANDANAYFTEAEKKLNAAFEQVETQINSALGDIPKQAERLLSAVNALDHSVRRLQNDLSRSGQTARMYADRVLSAAGRLDEGGLMAAPSNILKLYSAVTSVPEIAALKADIDRIRASFDEVDNIIKTTEANALFNRLGDELKALGLSLPFDKIGDRLLPANLSDFEIGNVFRNFGGAKLNNLLKGYKIPAGVSDAVRVTHDFDKKQARAWVQVDIDAPMGGRRSLFSVGVFKADFVDMHLTGQVRLEADQDKVSESGYGRVGTTIDLVVGGQSMVRFEKFGLSFTREKGLDVEFDPKNIRLNPSFKFIQDFLSTLFPDDIGGLEIIKQNGIPVGLQHDFAIPPLALNFGTSGVSNICIANHFKLLAFPDFMLANRFNLSSIERPFIFSIFIIGGTGYIQIDAEYRPFDNELTVCVEAGAGGSASLAFAFGPFSGQVFITLSGTLAYRKVIGKPGGGLSISAVLVIAGHVNVAGIVTVGIVLMLRMTYRDNGQIDADGSLTVVIRISRFFKITARANATYKLRGGKSETTVSSGVTGEVTDEKLNKLKKAAEKLEGARH